MMASDGMSAAEIERMVSDLGKKIDEVKVDLRSDIADLKLDIAAIKANVVYVDVHKVVTDNLVEKIDRANDRAQAAESIAKWALGTLVALLGVVITIAILIATSGPVGGP